MTFSSVWNAERLHIGGIQAKEGWRVLNVRAEPYVDFVGDCADLSRFPTHETAEVYASHVLEHLTGDQALHVLREIRRILRPDGRLMVAVPDLEALMRILTSPQSSAAEKITAVKIIYGGGETVYDDHRFGYTFEIISLMARTAGFATIARIGDFGLFRDTSMAGLNGTPISLNVEIRP